MNEHDFNKLARKSAAEIRPILLRLPIMVQGAVLAELIGDYLVANRVDGNDVATEMMRTAILQAIIETAQELIEVSGDGMPIAGHA